MTVVINGTTGITDVNGSASAPAITGLTTNTGMYFGTNTLGLSTNGTTAVAIDSNSSVTFTNAFSKVFSISASIASSALTISANPCSLDFRSTTLGSGTITTVAGTLANLVVPSTATLGTTSAVLFRLVVLVLNVSGTLELAVVNISGGTNLDETGLISTTAIAAGSNSATTIYSTTARSSVAYRVIGYIDSTQATAGTWATAPSTIQGYGGQALSSLSSIGYGQTWQTVTGTRALSTTYYNTTGRPILVQVFTTCATVNALNQLTINGVIVNQYCQAASTTGGTTSGIVPPMGSYSCTQGGASASIVAWTELR